MEITSIKIFNYGFKFFVLAGEGVMGKRQQKKFSIGKSLEMFKKAEELIPGGIQFLSRRPSRFVYGISPIFAEKSKRSLFLGC